MHRYITRLRLSRHRYDACAWFSLVRLFGPDDLADLKIPTHMAETGNPSGDAHLQPSRLRRETQDLVLKEIPAAVGFEGQQVLDFESLSPV